MRRQENHTRAHAQRVIRAAITRVRTNYWEIARGERAFARVRTKLTCAHERCEPASGGAAKIAVASVELKWLLLILAEDEMDLPDTVLAYERDEESPEVALVGGRPSNLLIRVLTKLVCIS